MLKKAIILSIYTNIFFGLTSPVFAVETPSFPICGNISAPVKVSYSSGVHGIPGKYDVYSGSDTVYQLTPETLAQCFCPETGATGTQTNWWKVDQLNEDQIQSLRAAGWIYVPNGALWGLDEAPYMAKNLEYTCRTTTTTTSSGGGDSSSGGVGGGGVLGTAGEILGLAKTGNITEILQITLAGLISLFVGVLLKQRYFKKNDGV